VFWTRRVYETIGGFREDLHYVMDYEYWLRALLAGFRVARTDHEFTAFRFQPNQKSEHSEQVAAELRALIRPLLWDNRTPIDVSTRRKLQGQWLYDEAFLPEVRRSLEAGETKATRWLNLLKLIGTHPQLLVSSGLARRFRSIVLPSGR